jgi:hypothetical protein
MFIENQRTIAFFLEPRHIPGKISGMRRIQIAIVLAFFALGSGPCDMFNPPDVNTEVDGSVDCPEEDCMDSIFIEVIRADNMEFLTGSYVFKTLLPDTSEYWIECYMAYGEAGLSCGTGDLHLLYAELGATGQTIWIQMLYAPESLLFTVEYNGYKIGERTIWPEYEEPFPDEIECPSTCLEAEETMAVQSW